MAKPSWRTPWPRPVWKERIGGSGYTSPGAVFSALMDKPGHISVIDEFGKLMESSQAHGNQIKADAISILMETFGRAHSTLRPAAYSLMTLSKEQREAFRQRKVCKPHLGILAMTTPSTFYESLSRQWIADGFLGRFLVCESPIGRQPSCYPEPAPVPEDVVEWLLAVGCQPTADGNLLPYDLGADLEPTPIVLDFSAGARHSLVAFETDILARMNDVERHGLEALFGRTVERPCAWPWWSAWPRAWGCAPSPPARYSGRSIMSWPAMPPWWSGPSGRLPIPASVASRTRAWNYCGPPVPRA